MKKELTIINHPLVQHKLTLMRCKETPSSSFRQLLKEISMLMTYEVTRDLSLQEVSIETPLCQTNAPLLGGENIVIVSIMRAGNGLLDGILGLIPTAQVGFVGLYRDEKTLKPVEYYCKVPDQLENCLVIAVDPMLATGNSSVAAVTRLKQAGAKDIRLLSLLAAPVGITCMQNEHPDVSIYTASIDEKLNEQGYIVPGLGDAGDRMFGTN